MGINGHFLASSLTSMIAAITADQRHDKLYHHSDDDNEYPKVEAPTGHRNLLVEATTTAIYGINCCLDTRAPGFTNTDGTGDSADPNTDTGVNGTPGTDAGSALNHDRGNDSYGGSASHGTSVATACGHSGGQHRGGGHRGRCGRRGGWRDSDTPLLYIQVSVHIGVLHP